MKIKERKPRRQKHRLQKLLFIFLACLVFIQLCIAINYNSGRFDPTEKISSTAILDASIGNPDIGVIDSKGQKDLKPVRATIAYVVSITSCKATSIADAAAVLKHSIHLSSYPQNKDSSYDYQMVAIVHPEAITCSEQLKKLDYNILVRESPIVVSQIKSEFLREHIHISGCCGEKEFLKLFAYTLVDYEIVVHLDLDSLILQPLDDLFDSMLLDGDAKSIVHKKLPVMHDESPPERIEAFFTRDYNMAHPGKKHINVQGGFLVVRPNLQYFEEYLEAILEGDFRRGAGWKGKYGGLYGGQQIQGICAYFFDGLHPGTAVELNRCIYNAMNDKPRGVNRKNEELCRDGKESCEDCRNTDIELIKSAHFTICQKPWECLTQTLSQPLCKEFHKKWFLVRDDLERELGVIRPNVHTDFHHDVFKGYCTGRGHKNYITFDMDVLEIVK